MKFILGKKLSMTQLWREDGTVVPVTRIVAGPCVITQVIPRGNDGQFRLQIAFGAARKLNKPKAGHLKDLPAMRELKEFGLEKPVEVKRGDRITVEQFSVGDRVEVVGISKGKGFAGVVKRHHFAGGPASHGHKDNLRAPGSIGAGGVQRVFKGVRMAGRMGGEQVTVKNLEIIAVDAKKNELMVKGAVPGARGGVVIISGAGELKVQEATSAGAGAGAVIPESAAVVAEAQVQEVANSAPAEAAKAASAPTEAPSSEAASAPAAETQA